MTFNIVVPNAGQSPGVFPAQNNTNYSRLKAIINAEHQFTDSSAVDEGIHKKCTFLNLASQPVGLPAGNGILYSYPDSGGASQLRWYNGASDQQISGGDNLLASGTATVATNSTATIFTLPPTDGFGMIYMWVTGNPTKMMTAIWTSAGDGMTGGVNIGVIPTKTPPVSSGTQKFPIYFSVDLTTAIRPFTSEATFNGTYNYRIFRLG